MLAAGAGRMGCFFVVVFSSSLSNASSLGRWLEILKYCGLGRYNPNGSCQLLLEACSLSNG